MSGVEGRDPYDDFVKINEELKVYDPTLLDRPQIVVASKMDMPDSAKNLAEFKVKLAKDKTLKQVPEVMEISSLTHRGLKELTHRTADVLESTPKFETLAEKEQASKVYTFKEDEPAFKITRDSDAT